ncbi:MAG: type I restriction-modification system subunit M [Acidobacteriota bacterium]|jgi:type I restriction enzyme M protein
MNNEISQDQINRAAWAACDTFRGTLDPANYKDYILTMLFVKYMSDLWLDRKEELERKYKGDKARLERALSRQRFIMPTESDFYFLYQNRDQTNIGELINTALEKIEEENKEKLENVFRNIDFNSEPFLGQTRERNRRLKSLLEDFHHDELNFRKNHVGHLDVLGNTYEYLIGHFAADAGKKAGEFFTPSEVSMLLAKLVAPNSGGRICDPACGSGSLLLKVAREVPDGNCSLYGQEMNGSTWALCRMNMFLHERDSARIEWGDTLNFPKLIESDSLMRFDVVVANPPFSLDKWGAEHAAGDKFNRFWRGVPPKSKGDYAFISHMIETAVEGTGRVGVVVPHGVLFRGGAEGKIRQKLIEENLFEAVIGLPANLFFGTGIPAAILVFDKGKKTTDVLFIDASREYEDGKNQNKLRDSDIEKIVATFKKFRSVEKYAYRATLGEIRENEFNLNIPRYVDTFEEEAEVDVNAVQAEIKSLEAQLAAVRREMAKHLIELGFDE